MLPLTPRESEIYRLMVEEAATARDIHERLGVSLHTAKRHRFNILNKVGADSCYQLVVWHYTKERK